MDSQLNKNPLLLEILNSIDALVAFWDKNQICTYANAAYLDWFGISTEQIIGGTLEALLGEIYELNLPYIKAAYHGATQTFERDIRCPDGIIRHSLTTYTPFIKDGEVQGIIVHVADVSQLKATELKLQQALEQAEHLATHDHLTGLPNRLLLEDRIENAIAVAIRNKSSFAITIIDIDNFKHVNDYHGHLAGDQLLVEVSARIKACLRKSDTLTRLGGDEFLLLAPSIATAGEAQSLTSRILAEARKPVHIDGINHITSLSIGTAFFPEHGRTIRELMLKSDLALYQAKGLGGSHSCIANLNESIGAGK